MDSVYANANAYARASALACASASALAPVSANVPVCALACHRPRRRARLTLPAGPFGPNSAMRLPCFGDVRIVHEQRRFPFALMAKSLGSGFAEGDKEKCPQKKGGTNGLAVRAGRPVTQTTSGLGDHPHNRNKYTIA